MNPYNSYMIRAVKPSFFVGGKMKRKFNQVFVFIMAFIFFISYPLSVFASSSGIHPDPDMPIINGIIHNMGPTAIFLGSQLKAVFTVDFIGFLENKAAWNDYWTPENIIVDETNNTVTFSEDLVAFIKQALREYAAETDTEFKIYETVDYNTLGRPAFSNDAIYETFRNLVEESDVLAAQYKIKNDNIDDLQDQWSGEPYNYSCVFQYSYIGSNKSTHLSYNYEFNGTFNYPVAAYYYANTNNFTGEITSYNINFLYASSSNIVSTCKIPYTCYLTKDSVTTMSTGTSNSLTAQVIGVYSFEHSYSTNFPVFSSYEEASDYLLGNVVLDETPDGIYDIIAYQPFEQLPVSLVSETADDSYAQVSFYDTDSTDQLSFHAREFNCSNDMEYSSFASGLLYSGDYTSALIGQLSGSVESFGKDNYVLFSVDGRRMKVYNSLNDFLNAGSRNVYYGSGFYEDIGSITVSFDYLMDYLDGKYDDLYDLLKQLIEDKEPGLSESDLEKIVDNLLLPDPSPPPGPGDVSGNVGSDLTSTNSWLEKIYNRLGDILDRMQEEIQASLDEISETLKKIRNWAAVDTVIDGVDVVADWLDLIYSVLKDGAGSAVSAVSTLAEDATDLMSQKFPFSIPWDILFFVSVLSAEPETPHFEIPFNFEYPALDLAVDYQMELDFTPLQWLSDLSRLILSMTYAAGLMKKTAEIVLTSKE